MPAKYIYLCTQCRNEIQREGKIKKRNPKCPVCLAIDTLVLIREA